MRFLRLGALVVLAVLIGAPAFAQFDLGGHWSRRSNQDDMESGPGPDPVDYLGLPLNDEGRARGLSFQYSAVSLPEHQCGYLSPFYIVLGPFGLAIDRVLDPVTARLVAWKIGGWVDRDVTTIWMDGRPHPGAECAPPVRRIHDRGVGRRHADDVYDPHQGRHDPAQRRAAERSGDDDHALHPAWRSADGPCRAPGSGVSLRAVREEPGLAARSGGQLRQRSRGPL